MSHKVTCLKCGQVLKKNELLKMLPKLFFFRILVFFYFWGIRNRELILDRFFGTAVIKICTEKWNKLILFERRKIWGVVKWLRFQKSDPRLILFTKILIRFFLSLKHPHALTFFFSHSLNHSLVDKKILEKKNSQSFFMRHFNKSCKSTSTDSSPSKTSFLNLNVWLPNIMMDYSLMQRTFFWSRFQSRVFFFWPFLPQKILA